MYKQVKLKPGSVVAGSCALMKTLSDILALAKFAFVISVQSFDAENFGTWPFFSLVCRRRIRLIFVPLKVHEMAQLMPQSENGWHYCQTIFLGEIFTLMQ